MEKLTLLIVVSCYFVGTLQSECSMEAKKGPYVLTKDNLPIQDTTNLQGKFIKIKVDKENAVVHMAKLYRKRSYCYDGWIDPNSGCTTIVESMNLTAEIVSKWALKGQCCVNFDLIEPMSGTAATDMWNSDGFRHQEQRCGLRLTPNNTERTMFAWHTYDESWGCEYHNHSTPIHLDCLSADQCDSTKMAIKMAGFDSMQMMPGKVFNKGGMSYYIDPTTTVVKDRVQLNCFTTNTTKEKDRFLCLDKVENIFVKDNTCIGNICYFGQSVITKETPLKKLKNSSQMSDNDKEIIAHIEYISELSNFNAHTLDARMMKLESIIISAINSLAKIDERLIGNILGTNMKTRFIDANTFESYPCNGIKIPSGTNCVGNHIFKNGRWVTKDSDDVCVTYNKPTEINVFGFAEMAELPVVSDRVDFVDQDWDAWDFVANSMDDLRDTMIGTNKGGKGTGLEFLVGQTKSFAKGLSYFTFFSSFLSSISIPLFIIVICFCVVLRR